jgi:hypothetical protein
VARTRKVRPEAGCDPEPGGGGVGEAYRAVYAGCAEWERACCRSCVRADPARCDAARRVRRNFERRRRQESGHFCVAHSRVVRESCRRPLATC